MNNLSLSTPGGFATSAQRKALYQKFGYDADNERIMIIEQAGSLKGKILEIGSGKGYFTEALAKKGCSFTSIDISPKEQQFAKDNLAAVGLSNRVDFQVADAHKMPFADKSFDIIFSVNSFHHIENQFSVLREIIRACADEAKIVISDFNLQGLDLIARLHQSEGREHKFFNVCWEAMEYFLNKKGFKTGFLNTKYQKTLFASSAGRGLLR